ncbi:hypothetical protein JCM14469_13450 [Desulfatiferula olefinivorans]
MKNKPDWVPDWRNDKEYTFISEGFQNSQQRKKKSDTFKAYIRFTLAWEFLRRSKDFQTTYQILAEKYPHYVTKHSVNKKEWILEPDCTPEIIEASYNFFGIYNGFFPSPEFPSYDIDHEGYATARIGFQAPTCAAYNYHGERTEIASIEQGMLDYNLKIATEADTPRKKENAKMKLGGQILKSVKLSEERTWTNLELIKGDIPISINIYGDIEQQILDIKAFAKGIRAALKHTSFEQPVKLNQPTDYYIKCLRAYDASEIYKEKIEEIAKILYKSKGENAKPLGCDYDCAAHAINRGKELVDYAWRELI